jgi:DNA-binding transcriptional regulator PaaX
MNGAKAAIREAMATTLERLTKAGWIEKSMVHGNSMRVVFTERGLQRLKLLSDIMKDDAWPRNNNEIICLMILCEDAEKMTSEGE